MIGTKYCSFSHQVAVAAVLVVAPYVLYSSAERMYANWLIIQFCTWILWGTFGDRLGGIENRFGTVKG